MSYAYYNERDKQAAAWLRELISEGHIANGYVDERSIEDVRANELAGFTQCHFFAGLGGWSLALRLAGWPDDRRVWTGSCPCQPFSAAGQGSGFADDRHLWPHWFHLITQCRPGVIFGEQVASKDGLAWLDVVHADLEGAEYAIGAEDLCAAGVGAPHIRQRLYFVADSQEHGWLERRGPVGERARLGHDGAACSLGHTDSVGAGWQRASIHRPEAGEGGRGCSDDAHAPGGALIVAQPAGSRSRGGEPTGQRPDAQLTAVERDGATGQLANTHGGHASAEWQQRGGEQRRVAQNSGAVRGHWAAAQWIYCRDGKWRPIEPGTFPLAHGVSGRVGLLRGYGNAIVPQLAAEFIRAYMT